MKPTYRIGADRYQWIVFRRQAPKPGAPLRKAREDRANDGWSAISYHPRLDQAVADLVEQAARDSLPPDPTLLEILQALKAAQAAAIAAIPTAWPLSRRQAPRDDDGPVSVLCGPPDADGLESTPTQPQTEDRP